jgi:restriction system protein
MVKRIKIDFTFEDSTNTTGKYLVFDLETTGLPNSMNAPPDDFENWPYIVQIAWMLFDNEQKLIEHKTFYVKQSVEIPKSATAVHGISTQLMLKKGIGPSTVYSDFIKVLKNTEYLIAHNIAFDVPILHCDFLRNDLEWKFPKNRMLCTMKTGTRFCKIKRNDGSYKWPKLTELYQKCFYPGYSVSFLHDPASGHNLHNAQIDAAMTAQCFFFLKKHGLFKNLTAKTEAKSPSSEQTMGKPERLHKITEDYEWTRDDETRYVAEIGHLGLNAFRVLKDIEKWRLDGKVSAQFKKWDERWERICRKKREEAEKESSLSIAQQRTQEAIEKQREIDELLVHTLGVEDAVDWDTLKDTRKFDVPNPKTNLDAELKKIAPPDKPPFREQAKEPSRELFEPKLFFFDRIIGSRREKKLRQAETLYQEALSSWRRSVEETMSYNANLKNKYEQKVRGVEEQRQIINNQFAKLESDWEKQKEMFYREQKEHNEKIERLKVNYFVRNPEAVIQYCEMVLNNSQYPETFPKDFDLGYHPDRKVLIVEYVLPIPNDMPRLTGVRYIASKNELRESFLSETQISKIYEASIYKVSLRSLHELFEADKADALETIIFNGWVNTINKGTGKRANSCIVSIQVGKAEFNEIELSNVDAKTCFKNLKGICGGKLSDITAIQPIERINKNDKRLTSLS